MARYEAERFCLPWTPGQGAEPSGARILESGAFWIERDTPAVPATSVIVAASGPACIG